MNICVIGTGYVGLVAGACLADVGNDVICVDNDLKKLEKLKCGIIPIFEPGLEEIVKNGVQNGRLKFSSDLTDAVRKSEVSFIAVGTPQGEDGSADLSYVETVARQIGDALSGGRHDFKVVVDKSTVPVGTAKRVKDIIASRYNGEFSVVSNPEFLKQGAAVDDFLKPDRVVVGCEDERSRELMARIYEPFFKVSNRTIFTDIASAEMIKYAANSFLAVKISFMNEIAKLCEKVGADVEQVRRGISTDERIGRAFLFAGLGYGGSCFPKDVKALVKTGNDNGVEMKIIKAADATNKEIRDVFLGKILREFGEDLTGRKFAFWGLAFKPKTDDMREAPAIFLINELLKRGAKVSAFDPKAYEQARFYFGDRIEYCGAPYEACRGACSLVLVTEWNEFRTPNFAKLGELLSSRVIFDGRNQWDEKEASKFGFRVVGVGRNY